MEIVKALGEGTGDFAFALKCMKDGYRVMRIGWNAPGQYVTLQRGYPEGIAINRNTAEATGLPEGTTCIFRPYFMLCGADGSFVPWVPTVSDCLAEDWMVKPKMIGV